jgi:hypothetical protein
MSQEVFQAAVSAAVAAILQQQPAASRQQPDKYTDLPPLLTSSQVHTVTGWSKSEINRMLIDGRIPSLDGGSGNVYRRRWVSKKFLLDLLADLDSGKPIQLREYTARWNSSGQQPGAVAS